MKKLLILVLFLGLMTSCVQTERYDAVARNGRKIVIRDSQGWIEQAIQRGDDSVSVVTSHLEFNNEFRSMDYLHRKDTFMIYDEYVDGKKYTGFLEYKVIKTSTITKR
jgi:hypothetical protein